MSTTLGATSSATGRGTKRKAAASAESGGRSSSHKSGLLVSINQHLSALRQKEEALVKAVDAMNTMRANGIEELVLRIDQQTKELAELEEKYQKRLRETEEDAQRYKKAKVEDADQELRAEGYAKALAILRERSEVAIAADELETLRENLRQAQADRTAELEAVRTREQQKGQAALDRERERLALMHEREVAGIKAKLEQKDEQISVMERANSDLKGEIKAARELVRHVAEAQRAAPVHHHAK